MKRKYLYLSFIVLALVASFITWRFWPPHAVAVKQTPFSRLQGWDQADFKKSFEVFKTSCKAFVKQSPEKNVGSEYIALKVKDWLPSCQAALALQADTSEQAKAFFEHWFTPVAFHQNKPIEGLFTGYYQPLLKGSLKKSKEFSIPLYSTPNNLITVDLGPFDPSLKRHRRLKGRVAGKKLIPYFTRKQISTGAIDKHAHVVAWIADEVDRQFLEIEGSGTLELEDGRQLYLGYDDENGAPYTSIASVLIKMGVMTRDNASMQKIRTYFKKNPQKVASVLNKNKSFVFFRVLEENAAFGAQGVPLTAGYSLAIDRKWVPMGAPIWLTTTRPTKKSDGQAPFNRLMVAQDTGGAIKGAVRGDVFWGGGKSATYIAGHMKNKGYYWILLPRDSANSLKAQNKPLTV